MPSASSEPALLPLPFPFGSSLPITSPGFPSPRPTPVPLLPKTICGMSIFGMEIEIFPFFPLLLKIFPDFINFLSSLRILPETTSRNSLWSSFILRGISHLSFSFL